MVIIELKDGTKYYVDTDNIEQAIYAVDYKKRQRLDYREITNTTVIKGAILDKNGKYYNSASVYDGVPLKAATGWSYRWGSEEYVEQCAEFR